MTGFIQEKSREKTPLVGDSFRHAMCVGETGCGKTTSFVLPNLKDRMQKNHGIFILDYKGILHLQVKALAKKVGRLQDVVEIGTTWGHKVNILKNVNKNLFLESIDMLNGEGVDDFWANSALNWFDNIFEAFALQKYILHLTDELGMFTENRGEFNARKIIKSFQNKTSVHKFTSKLDSFRLRFFDEKLLDVVDEKNKKIVLSVKSYLQRLEKLHKKFENLHDSMDEDRPTSGSYGVIFQALNTIMTLKSDCLNGEDDMLDLLSDGKIVIFRNDDFSPRTSLPVMNILYKRLTKRYNSSRPISLFVDEFQRSITKETLPHVDVFRERKVELIAAMQNIEQLQSVAGETETDAFMQNIIEVFEYQKETFNYTKDDKSFIAKPIFFSQEELDLAQARWQSTLSVDKRLPKDWIYIEAKDNYTCEIKNIKTGEIKTHFYTHKTDDDFTSKVNEKIKKPRKILMPNDEDESKISKDYLYDLENLL